AEPQKFDCAQNDPYGVRADAAETQNRINTSPRPPRKRPRPRHTERAYASRTPSEAQERRGGGCDGISGEKRTAVTGE
ncbi:MAG: hypothetical protein UHG68_01000, partial [Clostridia bacterium]|nr:hypothetical protein [Clostridia bacterium]